MKIAYLGIKGIPAQAGADRVVEAIATRMPRFGISPVVYCDKAHTPVGTSIPGIDLVRLSAAGGKHTRAVTLDLLAAWHAVLHGQYDLIHLHNVETSFVLPLLHLRYPVVSTSHGAAYWRAKWGPIAKRMIQMTEYPFMKLSTVVTSVSAKDAQDLAKRFSRPVEYIPNGVGLENTPDRARTFLLLEQFDLEAGNYFLFVAGRIEPTKGAHLAIQAINRLNRSIRLFIVGDSDQIPEYGKHLREMAGPSVTFHPPIREPGLLFGLMANAQSLIFPSTVEAMSMVLLEAAATGVPVICGDIPENRHVMQDDAVYFESGNVGSLVQQLEWSLQHREELVSISTRAQNRIKRDFSWDLIAEQYYQAYCKASRQATFPRVILSQPSSNSNVQTNG